MVKSVFINPYRYWVHLLQPIVITSIKHYTKWILFHRTFKLLEKIITDGIKNCGGFSFTTCKLLCNFTVGKFAPDNQG